MARNMVMEYTVCVARSIAMGYTFAMTCSGSMDYILAVTRISRMGCSRDVTCTALLDYSCILARNWLVGYKSSMA